MNSIKKEVFYVMLSMLWIMLLSGCNDNQSMPSIEKGTKVLRVDSRASIGGLRALDMSADFTDPNNADNPSLAIDFNSDTWNNTDNKPRVFVIVNNKTVKEIPSGNYTYIRNGASSSIHISCNINYTTEQDVVRFYLVDKSLKIISNRIASDQNGNILEPLSDGGKKNLKLIFSATTNIEKLKANQTLSFVPAGTMILFEQEVRESETKDITINSPYFSDIGYLSMYDGFAKGSAIDNKTFTLKGSSKGKAIYGIYCFTTGRTTDNHIEFKNTTDLESTLRYYLKEKENYDSKFIYIKIPVIKDNDWFILESSNLVNESSLSIDLYKKSYDGLAPILQYREKGTEKWIQCNYKLPSSYRLISDSHYFDHLDARLPIEDGKTIELRAFGMSYIQTHSSDAWNITQWGTTKWTSMEESFDIYGLDVVAQDIPDLSRCKNLSKMFFGCSNLVGNDKFKYWNTSNVTNMSEMFYCAYEFNQDISGWDVSNVTNMSQMFWSANKFNQDISKWDVSNVTNMSQMFNFAYEFNQDISKWDVSNVIDWQDIFALCPIKTEYQPAKFRE